MSERHEQELEQRLHRELRKLPDRRAPETLVHRVMLAVHARERRPWWQRPWLTWPAPAPLISAAFSVAALAAVVYSGSAAWQAAGIGNPLDRVMEWLASLTSAWDLLTSLVNALVLVLQQGGRQYLLIGLAVASTMYLVCVATGSACYRLAFSRR